VITVRAFGREVLTVGRCECDGAEDIEASGTDLTGGTFDLADGEPFERDEVYLARRRQRPPLVAVGSRHRAPRRVEFGFTRTDRSQTAVMRLDGSDPTRIAIKSGRNAAGRATK
jgi:hypothetical protein